MLEVFLTSILLTAIFQILTAIFDNNDEVNFIIFIITFIPVATIISIIMLFLIVIFNKEPSNIRLIVYGIIAIIILYSVVYIHNEVNMDSSNGGGHSGSLI